MTHMQYYALPNDSHALPNNSHAQKSGSHVSVSVLATPLAYDCVITKYSLSQMMLLRSHGAAVTTLGWHQVSTGVTSYYQANVALDNKLK